ncbi:MAG: hypothetical protein ACHQZR_07485, partial [Candidatus Limnocylindrales bacterium]
MDPQLERRTTGLADAYLAGKLSRRSFVTRLLALGLAPTTVAAIVAACGSSATATPTATVTAGATGTPAASTAPSPSPSPLDLSGKVRFYVGPWSDKEVQHHQQIGQAFTALYPKVSFEYDLYDWSTAAQQINTSVTEGAHDIYMTTESSYPDFESKTGFIDLTARINDPSFAAEKAKYLYMDRIAAYGPKILGLPISWHVEDAMFVNMDMVKAAGFDEHFADTWDT